MSYDRRSTSPSNPFTGNTELTKKGWDASGAILDEYKALKQLVEAVQNLHTVHAKNSLAWKALREDLDKVDPGRDQIRDLLLSATSQAIAYGIDLRDLPLKEMEHGLTEVIKDCDSIHRNLSGILG